MPAAYAFRRHTKYQKLILWPSSNLYISSEINNLNEMRTRFSRMSPILNNALYKGAIIRIDVILRYYTKFLFNISIFIAHGRKNP